MPGPLDIIHRRGSLIRTREALKAGRLTLGFIGGSITDARPGWNWPGPVCDWFNRRFPQARLRVENAAIGATGSDLAVFRAGRDLIRHDCDLVFIEFAVNDEGAEAEARMRWREGLVRKLLRDGQRDVVLAYTHSSQMNTDMTLGRMPATIADFEKLAERYAIGSVWMGLYAFREVGAGRMSMEEWLPDGLHPQVRGSQSYAQSVIGFLVQELVEAPGAKPIPWGKDLPVPLSSANWEQASSLSFAQVSLDGPWQVQRWPKLVWIDQVLHTSTPGAKLAFSFSGRGLVLAFDFGKASAEFRYRLDGGEWQTSDRDRPDWCGPDGWYRTFHVADDLKPGKHSFELEVVDGNPAGDRDASRYSGTNFDLALIGIVP